MKYVKPEMEIIELNCVPITQVSVVPGKTVDGVPDVDLSNKIF